MAKDALEKTILEGVQLLAVLVGNEINAKDMLTSGCPEVLVFLIRTMSDNREVVRRALVCLSKLCVTKDQAAELASKGVVVAAVEAMLSRKEDALFQTDVLRLMVNLAIQEQNAIQLSETAIRGLILCVDNNFASQTFLRMFFLLMSNLSMWPKASKHLIDAGLIRVVVDTLKASVNFPILLVKMIKVLTNFILVGETAKRELIREGALAIVREMTQIHGKHIQLSKVIRFAL